MIEILDTTLRDGEQTSGVSFVGSEKMHIARLLIEDLRVDRLEIASAKVSEGEFETVKRVAGWAAANNYIDKVEVLGFVDGDVSLNWVKNAGCRIMNLLCKGSLKHCTEQLRKTPEQHLSAIRTVLDYAAKMDIRINIYLEDWSNGMLNSPDYVFFLMDNLKDTGIEHFMLPDTLGILNPLNTYKFCKTMCEKYPNLRFDFHAHNDYDLAIGNIFSAISAGITGIHTTINGLGERAGNAPLASVIAVLHDQLNIRTNIIENNLNRVSRIIESYSGMRIPNNKPVIGDSVFTQCAGIHADGDNKNNLYYNDLLPERFGRAREYALGKTSGSLSQSIFACTTESFRQQVVVIQIVFIISIGMNTCTLGKNTVSNYWFVIRNAHPRIRFDDATNAVQVIFDNVCPDIQLVVKHSDNTGQRSVSRSFSQSVNCGMNAGDACADCGKYVSDS